jgi:hypothetical protein
MELKSGIYESLIYEALKKSEQPLCDLTSVVDD